MIGTLLEKMFIAVGVDLSEFNAEFDKASRELDQFSKQAKRDMEAVGRSWQDTGKKMMKGGAVMTAGITAPLAIFGKASAQAAIDAEEMNSAFDVVFGDMSASVRQWAEETGNAMGRSTQEMQRGALAFQELFDKVLDPKKASAMSKEFAVLTQDLASFKNLSNEAAQQKLFSGLTGEAEPLKAIGVFINEASVKAKGLELGLGAVNGKMTDQEKILARAALIREQLAQADGDVMRTSESTANRIKASQGAFEELSITVGENLIPAITPLIEIVSSMLESFNELDPGMQTFIVGAVGIAAIIGPLVTVIGAFATGAGMLITALGGGAAIISTFGMALNTLLLSPLGLVVLAVAAVVAAFVYWDEIVVVLEKVGKAISDWYVKNVKPTVDLVMAAIEPLVTFFKDYFGAQIEGTIKVISALLDGDFSGAWQAAKEMVANMASAMLGAVAALSAGAVEYMRSLYNGVKSWIMDKLGAVWDWLKGKVDDVKGYFFDLYDAVVGNSYIPDMVERIGEEMGKLQALMVDPARKATESVDEAFRRLASNTEGLLARLFPVHSQIKEIMADLATLDKALAEGLISPETHSQGRARLKGELWDARQSARGPLPISPDVINQGPIDTGMEEITLVLEELPPLLDEAGQALEDFGISIGDGIMGALHDVLDGENFFDSLKNGFFNVLNDAMHSALSDLESVAFGEGGLGGFIGGLFTSLLGGGARAVGGPVLPGRAYDVGLGEKFVPSQTGRVLSRSDAMKAAGGGGALQSITVKVSGARGNAEIKQMVEAGVKSGLDQYDNVVGQRANNSFRRRG